VNSQVFWFIGSHSVFGVEIGVEVFKLFVLLTKSLFVFHVVIFEDDFQNNLPTSLSLNALLNSLTSSILQLSGYQVLD
jgi:hypothetical protein